MGYSNTALAVLVSFSQTKQTKHTHILQLKSIDQVLWFQHQLEFNHSIVLCCNVDPFQWIELMNDKSVNRNFGKESKWEN